jgi:hypothetical protein
MPPPARVKAPESFDRSTNPPPETVKLCFGITHPPPFFDFTTAMQLARFGQGAQRLAKSQRSRVETKKSASREKKFENPRGRVIGVGMKSPPDVVHEGRGATCNPPNRFEPISVEPDPDYAEFDEHGVPVERPSPQTRFYHDATAGVSIPTAAANTGAPIVLPGLTTSTWDGAPGSISKRRSW